MLSNSARRSGHNATCLASLLALPSTKLHKLLTRYAFYSVHVSAPWCYKYRSDCLQLFDKVTVLYEGQQIYFGPADEARAYFERLGFECPASQTTPDFLTSMTSASERRVRPGFENATPRTSDDFAKCWKESPERKRLLMDIEDYNNSHPLKGEQLQRFALSRALEKSSNQRQNSPYTLSYVSQVFLCMWRDIQRIKNDPTVPLAMLFINFVESLVVSSIFFNLPQTTASFVKRGGAIFMVVSLHKLIFWR